jgi:hypothetical protein
MDDVLELSFDLLLTSYISMVPFFEGRVSTRIWMYLGGKCSIAWACLQSFFSGYFGDKDLLFAQAGLNKNLPILYFPLYLGWQAHSTTFIFFLLRWVSWIFLPGLAWNHHPPELSLLHSWNDRCTLAVGWDEVLWTFCQGWSWYQPSMLCVLQVINQCWQIIMNLSP